MKTAVENSFIFMGKYDWFIIFRHDASVGLQLEITKPSHTPQGLIGYEDTLGCQPGQHSDMSGCLNYFGPITEVTGTGRSTNHICMFLQHRYMSGSQSEASGYGSYSAAIKMYQSNRRQIRVSRVRGYAQITRDTF